MVPIPRPDELLMSVLNRQGDVILFATEFHDKEGIILLQDKTSIANVTLFMFDHDYRHALGYAPDRQSEGHIVLYRCNDILAVKVFANVRQIIGIECKTCEVTRFGTQEFQLVMQHRFGNIKGRNR